VNHAFTVFCLRAERAPACGALWPRIGRAILPGKTFRGSRYTWAQVLSVARAAADEKRAALLCALRVVADRLKRTDTIAAIAKELRAALYSPNFSSDLLDKNRALLSTPSGVLDMGSRPFVFRPAQPSDLISKLTGVDYVADFTLGSPGVRSYLSYLEQLHSDPDVRMYFRKLNASYLLGSVSDRTLVVWYGSNSKSTQLNILQKALGSYALVVEGQVVVDDTIHLVVVPDAPWEDGGIIREYKRAREAGAKLLLICDRPLLTVGKAAQGHVCVIPFLSEWVDAEGNARHKFRADRRFGAIENIRSLARGMLWLMVHDYEMYLREGIRDPPPLVREATQNYFLGRKAT
jgi:hypothetical protein